MVDIHSHVLYGVDDGPETSEDSLRMLRKAERSGVEIVVATPHLLRGLYEIGLRERDQMVTDLQEMANKNRINIQIKPGFECYLSPDTFDNVSDLAELTINNNGKYILVELPMQSIPSYIESMLFDLMTRGLTPIIAHPERNMSICQDPNVLFEFVSRGCVIQLNAGSILGHYGKIPKKIAKILLTHKLVHVIASDMHSIQSPSLDQVISPVGKLLDIETISRMLSETPRQIIAGEEIQREPPQRYGTTKRSKVTFKRKKSR